MNNPSLLENDIFVLDFSAKAQIFNDYFVPQCKSLDTASENQPVPQHEAAPPTDFYFSEANIFKVIRSLNPKERGLWWNEISCRMIFSLKPE